MEYKPNDFRSDLALSDVFSGFLDQYFYKPMESLIIEQDSQAADVHFERVLDKNPQLRGFDVILHEGSWATPIDEKAQLTRINDPLDTFCFELSYIKNGEAMPGWLLDSAKKTAAYMLCWPKRAKEAKDTFTGADMLLVFCNRVKKFLECKGYTHEVLCQREEYIRENGLCGRRSSGCSDFWFAFSPQLREQPINVIFKIELLKKLSSADMSVSLDPETGKSTITGNWLGQEINTAIVA